MTHRETFPASERLKSRTMVDRLFSEGASGFVFPLRYMTLTEKSDSPGVEVLFSVPKKRFKRANKRNTLRRRMRESYRRAKHTLIAKAEAEGVVIRLAFVYSAAEELNYKAIDNAITRILAERACRP